jgi:hypothetical protein
MMLVQEGVDGLLECDCAAWQSNDFPHEPLSRLSQQTRAAGASHAVATAQVGASAMGCCRSKWALCCGRKPKLGMQQLPNIEGV